MEDNLKLRKALATEAELLSDLALRSKAHWDYSAEFIEACREELTYSQQDLENNHFYVLEESLEDSKVVVGFYALIQLSSQTIELEALFVEPACIGKGYGRKLIEHGKDRARALGASKMLIHGDPNAKKFYETIGGVLIDEKESGSIAGRYLPLFEIYLS